MQIDPTQPIATLAEEDSRAAAALLYPLIGLRGRYRDRMFEIIDVLPEGPRVALLDTSSAPGIRVTQFGDALARQSRIVTLPVFSTLEEGELHPTVAALLPADLAAELRALYRGWAG